MREQTYRYCPGCNTSFLVENRYPEGCRPIIVEGASLCPQCREEHAESPPALSIHVTDRASGKGKMGGG